MPDGSIHTLYGTPLSLYTGKARSYLIKNALPYRELTPSTTHYEERVLPLAKKRMMPTVETADGQVIRDGAAIVDHFETLAGRPALPDGPCQRILALLFDVIGMEGLLRPAMHYRWNFPEENHDFLLFHFASVAPTGMDATKVAVKNMQRMREAAMAFGVVPEAMPGIEARYLDFLVALDRHFAEVPYLLGDRPSIGDFSLIAPLYGHLGRDPKPLALLQAKAVHVFRWVERMNRPEPDRGEYVRDGEAPVGEAFLPNDEIPETLRDVARRIAVDFVPETLAAAAFINDWLAKEPALPSGTPLERGLGLARFEVGGETLHGLAQPYRFYLLARAQAELDSMSADDRKQVEPVLEDCHLLPVLDARLTRSIRREENLEVWA